ncbi:hypothetical protein Pmani_032192 [Petrolisthes manimaculis]|uniref:Uncharacterized protein n=1 Tax=Petrolisthes manimaculis TaxID=1843537 RepID=A0AAE1NS83_9EUCA|nr:hypothetical protein Pmani_032192 [Petrolisthes manimaculis]
MNDGLWERHKLSRADQKPSGTSEGIRERAKTCGKERRRVGATEISDSSRPGLSHQPHTHGSPAVLSRMPGASTSLTSSFFFVGLFRVDAGGTGVS